MSNSRNADHVTLPAICRLFSIVVKCGRAVFRLRHLPGRPLVSHLF